jgi:aminoglycoside phosphotransferase (APT) family kinase protein
MNTDNDEYITRLLEEDVLAAYLEDQLGAVEAFDVEYHQAGHSNETVFITWGADQLVLRRPPPGATAETAHDVLREYRIIDAFQETDVLVPPTVLACDDQSIIGSEFYVMERVEGDVIRSEEPPRFSAPKQRRQIGTELIDGLSAVHTLDYEALGLGDLGSPDAYTERQVERWQKQFEWALERTSEMRSLPSLSQISDWLTANIPDETPETMVHGDYKLDNVMYGPGTPPELVAIFDWEMSTIGNSRMDLGWLLAHWWEPTDPDPPHDEIFQTVTTNTGYPSRTELIQLYEDQTGIEFTDQKFYRTFGAFKTAAACEMFFRRYLEGNANDPVYPSMEDAVPRMLDYCSRIIDSETSR